MITGRPTQQLNVTMMHDMYRCIIRVVAMKYMGRVGSAAFSIVVRTH